MISSGINCTITTFAFMALVVWIANANHWPASPYWWLVPIGICVIWGRGMILIMGILVTALIWFNHIAG